MIPKLILITLTSLIVQSGYTQDTASFYVVKDTYINTVIADQVQGEAQSIIAATWTYGGVKGYGRSLFGFEVCDLPKDLELIKAELYLYYDYSAGHAGHSSNGLNSAKLYPIISSWDENTTWASQPSYDEGINANLPSSASSSQDYQLDVTNIVLSELATSNEIDFYFKLDNEQTYRSLVFASSDHPDVTIRPRLELIYSHKETWCGNDSQQEVLDACAELMIIPNTFTPNKDLINDFFELDSLECELDSFSIQIFNRWGNLVFESIDESFTWDGENHKNKTPLADGTYFYAITLRKGSAEIGKSGSITMLR